MHAVSQSLFPSAPTQISFPPNSKWTNKAIFTFNYSSTFEPLNLTKKKSSCPKQNWALLVSLKTKIPRCPFYHTNSILD